MADDASPALSIRRSMRQMNDRVHSTLTSMVNGAMRTYLQDAVITMRDGRYCLPVKAEHRSQVPGMIHDQSATGSTLFIEPMAVVKLNNEFQRAVVKRTTGNGKNSVGLKRETTAWADQITGDYDILVELDFIFAKAMLAKRWMPSVRFSMTNAAFASRMAAIRCWIRRRSFRSQSGWVMISGFLIITGPNTGGKTVSLKTVGLFTLMGQAGLHIPAFEGSELGVFDNVFADIGDEQSIEQSLSTFSSHMTTIVKILKEMDTNSLVLFR